MTATLPPNTDTRDCHLYRFWVRHPVTGERVLGYVGETVRLPFERLMEHVMSQPWADTILAWEVDDVVYCGKQAVLEAETRAIQSELPLYNVRKNEQNPYRIIPPDAIRQRRARDLERGKPRWVHPDDRDLASSAIRPAPQPRPARRLKPWQIKTGLWSTVWVLLTAGMWGGLDHTGLTATWQTEALSACLASLTMCLWGLAGAPISRRQRRASLRRIRNRCRRWWGWWGW